MRRKMTTFLFGATCLVVGTLVVAAGCNTQTKQRRNRRTVKATIADFDPKADFVLDLDAWGTDRADDYEVEQAFNQTFDALDQCVLDHKGRNGMSGDRRVDGDMTIAVRLNPKESRPFAVNAKLPGKLGKKKKLKECIREAVAAAPFPTYDGPPQDAEFECEVDPGMADAD